MRTTDARTLLTALRDLLGSAQGLVQHLLALHGGPDSIVTPPPPPEPLGLPSGPMKGKTVVSRAGAVDSGRGRSGTGRGGRGSSKTGKR
jgi:hypothetical protein